LVATKSWPNPLIVLFFTFIRDSINFKWLHSVHSFKLDVGWWKYDQLFEMFIIGQVETT
jgi:hypothetical protein